MLADHAARVLARGAGLGAEARRPGGDAHRQLRLVDDVLAHEIGERHFGGGDEPEIRSLGETACVMAIRLSRLTSVRASICDESCLFCSNVSE